jgi:hypothetical protein
MAGHAQLLPESLDLLILAAPVAGALAAQPEEI